MKDSKALKQSRAGEEKDGRTWFFRGMKAGVPIGLGYFAVSFTLGIAAQKAGMNAFQSGFMSAAMLASAGQFAGIQALVSGAGYVEMIVTEIVVNRLIMAYGVTDEIFAVSMGVEGKLDPCYMYGATVVAAPGWVAGTVMGALLGMALPPRMMSAMGVALYGMFLAVVVPPSKKSRIIAGVVLVSMAASAAFSWIPFLENLSSGVQIILLTIIVSGAAAVLFPVKEEE